MSSIAAVKENNLTRRGIDLTRKRMEPAGSGATWTGSPKGVFAARKHHKPRQSLKNNTAGTVRSARTLRREVPSTASEPREAGASVLVKTARERRDANRTREAGNRGEVEGVVAMTLNAFRGGGVGLIDSLDDECHFLANHRSRPRRTRDAETRIRKIEPRPTKA